MIDGNNKMENILFYSYILVLKPNKKNLLTQKHIQKNQRKKENPPHHISITYITAK